MVITRSIPLALSANARFKLRYRRNLRWAALAAVLLTLLAAWLSPRYEAHPYQLRQKEIVIIDIAPPDVVPEKPEVAPPPPLPRPVEVVDDSEAEDTFEITRFLDIDLPPPPPPVFDDTSFVASSSNPVLVLQPKPEYPEIARRAGLEGTVLVRVLVSKTGLVEEAEILQGVNPLLDKAALAAARRCRFQPARQREFPVAAWMAVPYRFRLH